jgi:hemin uptake protein HemP
MSNKGDLAGVLARQAALAQRTGPAPHIRSGDLFGNAREVVIEHNQKLYRLRLTAQGKLILTA